MCCLMIFAMSMQCMIFLEGISKLCPRNQFYQYHLCIVIVVLIIMFVSSSWLGMCRASLVSLDLSVLSILMRSNNNLDSHKS